MRCGICKRKMQGSWNNGKPHYRCTFLSQYAGGAVHGRSDDRAGPHKASHTAVGISGTEEPLGELRVRASATQAERLLEWAAAWSASPRWSASGF